MPPPLPPPHIIVLVDGHTAADDPNFNVTMYAGLPYVMTFTGNHFFAAGELAAWTVQGTSCSSSLGTYAVLDANLGMTTTLTAGSYELCLSQVVERPPIKYTHITASVYSLPPSPPPPSPPLPASPPPPSPPPPSPPPPLPLPPLHPGGSVSKLYSLLTTLGALEPTPTLAQALQEQIVGRFAAQAEVDESSVSVITSGAAAAALAQAQEQLEAADIMLGNAVREESESSFYDALRTMREAQQVVARSQDTLAVTANGELVLVEVRTVSPEHSENVSLLLSHNLSSAASASAFVGMPLGGTPRRDIRVTVVVNPAPSPPPAPPTPPPSPKPEMPVQLASLMDALSEGSASSTGNVAEDAAAAQGFMNGVTDVISQSSGALPEETVTNLMAAAASVLPPPVTSTTSTSSTTSAADASARAETARSALSFVAAVSGAATSMSVETAATATAVLSFVLEEPSIADSGGDSGSVVSAAVTGIANAVLHQSAGSEGPQNETRTVTMSTPNLNITAESKPASEISTKPSVCQTAGA